MLDSLKFSFPEESSELLLIAGFVEGTSRSLPQMLGWEILSFSASEIDIIMNDCYSKETLVKDMRDFSRPVLKLVHKAGYFEESFVTERLAGEGFPVNLFLSA
ncbi:hypothetical protein P0082_08905 [Candidatus Haliotispira prima]|uniref:Uncharacterized protein n=1 Tax=Candidatus Haliotispira prima TaxID=3034016 RepID=A0ABY8MF95_9SPIO|nr:hypothetical protein P0082_08905 [Candidatus Haliotispira prima]